MPVSDMKKIYISALKKDQQRLVAYLQRQEQVEVETYDCGQSPAFSAVDLAPEIADLRGKALRVQEAIDILDAHFPAKASLWAAFEGKEVKTLSEYEAFGQNRESVLQRAERVCDVEKQMVGARDDMGGLYEKMESLRPWRQLQVPLGFSGTVHTAAWIGSLPQGYTAEELADTIASFGADPGRFVFSVIAAHSGQTRLMAMAMRRDEKEMEGLLGQLQFSRPPWVTDQAPGEELEILERAVKEKEELVESLTDELLQLSKDRQDLHFLLDCLHILTAEYQAFGQMGAGRYAFALTGYVPARELEGISRGLEKRFICAIRVAQVTEEEAPSYLRNSWFSQPLESVVESYNYPRYREMDPTALTSFFYYFMFGLMFSDACYGAVLALVCGGLLLKFRGMHEDTSKFLRLFFWCGVSTLAWGIVFSSYFGDVVDVFSSTYLGRHLSIAPLWFAPLEQPMRLLLFCLAVGIVHVTVGYGANLYGALRARDIPSAVFDSLVPVLFLFSLLTVFMGTEAFRGLSGFALILSPALTGACLGTAGVSVMIILLTSGRESKHWVKRILKGIFGLYNVLAGWISDILSYSRLLALGLATGVIGSVINTLAAMTGKGTVGIILFFIVFALGHAMNFGINILGSYVHSNRLAYVEFFGKFYEGGGRKFRPLGLHTKYYSIREEN